MDKPQSFEEVFKDAYDYWIDDADIHRYEGAKGLADQVWQHQQAKVEELQKQLSEYIFVAETLDEMYVKEAQKSDDLQKRVDEIVSIATELAEYASYAEIVGGVTVNRAAVRSFCDKVFDFNRKVNKEIEQALKGEGQ